MGCRKASPGQLSNFEEELFKSSDMLDAPIIMSATSQITDGVRTVGIAYVDATSRHLGATQFDDDDQLCALERILVQLGAKECVLPQARPNLLQCSNRLKCSCMSFCMMLRDFVRPPCLSDVTSCAETEFLQIQWKGVRSILVITWRHL